MKEKTKKIMKGLGLSLGAVALLSVGVGVGACSVKYGSMQPTTTTPIRKSLKERPKLFENGKANLADYAIGGYGINNPDYNSFESGPTISSSTYGLRYGYEKKPLEKGVYKVTSEKDFMVFTNDESVAWTCFEDAVDGVELTTARYAWDGSPLSVAQYWAKSFYFDYDGTNQYYFNAGGVLQIELINMQEIPSNRSITLPKQWFPSSSITGTPAFPFVNGTTGTTGQIKLTKIEGLWFRSNGVVYNSLVFSWRNAFGMAYGENRTAIQSSDLWFLEFAAFGTIGGKWDLVYVPNDGVTADGNIYFNGSYSWVSDVYRDIDILEYGGSSTLDGTTMTNEQWLGVLSNGQATDYDTSSLGSGLGIITGALTAILPLLAIQVLPNITLGLLLALPLIGSIVVLIIKAVKK